MQTISQAYQRPDPIQSLRTIQPMGVYVCKTRGDDIVPPGSSSKYDTIVDYFVSEITGPYDQDISMLLVGSKGTGKSRASLSLCYYCACEVAERMGGNWKDYFDPFRTMAVISADEATRVMGIQDKYSIKMLDDIGVSWSARSWQQKSNLDKNSIFQINRIDRTIAILSVPNQFLLDKVPRNLVNFYAEMDQPFFAHGFTTMKLFHPQTLFREGRVIQPYLHASRTKYVLYRIPKPPEFLDKIYSKIRKDRTNEAIQERSLAKNEAEKQAVCKNGNTRIMEETIMAHSKGIMDIMNAGGQKNEILEFLLRDADLPKQRVKYWFKSGAMARLGFDPK